MENQISNLQINLDKSLADFKNEISGVRTDRPSPKLLEDIKVDYYGQELPIKQLGSIYIIPPRTLQIDVWDKGVVSIIMKVLEKSDLGTSPNNQGNSIFINLPSLTEERRREIAKLIKSLSENSRIKIRTLRDEFNKKIKQAEDGGEITEDERFKFLSDIQKTVDRANEMINKLLEAKLEEIKK